jgi:hypothetical protein
MMSNKFTFITGVCTLVVIGATGCGTVASSASKSSAGTSTGTVSTSNQSKAVYYVPQALPTNTVLRSIQTSESQINLDYAPSNYNSMVANTFSIHETTGEIPMTNHPNVSLSSGINGIYKHDNKTYVQNLEFDIPNRLTNKPNVLISIHADETKTFGRMQMIAVANQVISNAVINSGISR